MSYRRSEVPDGGPALEGISGGGGPIPISGSCVKRKPCGIHGLNSLKSKNEFFEFILYIYQVSGLLYVMKKEYCEAKFELS